MAGSDRLQQVFAAALEIESDTERCAYLDQTCAGDDPLREKVELLLQAHEQAGSFLLETDPDATVQAPPIEDLVGENIGPYKLREQLGEGGFGVVYVAEQTEPVKRKVALKVIKPGMDTKEIVARFGAERQALALMDHPHIARVLDAGATEQGRPYFVMELVKGRPITTFCDEQQLDLTERLKLFQDVCEAVQHAHQKGIIHRDIKPSNVLVTAAAGKPLVKVIDFGVAKALHQKLTEQTLWTSIQQVVGTPLYMSPEQADQAGTGHDIDTRTDVYSLGVLLYELLTGSTPFSRETMKQAGLDEVRRIIREEEPAKPSLRLSTLGDTLPSVAAVRKLEPKRLSAFVRGDLDWIVMKALEKDRDRRYATASAFADDLQRYQDHEPVEASPPSNLYRLRKFARRNKAIMTTTLLVAMALITGTAVATWQAIEADRERNRAVEAERLAEERLEEVQNALLQVKEAKLLADQRSSEAERARTQAVTNFKIAMEAVDQMLTRVSEEQLIAIPEMAPVRTQLLNDAAEFHNRLNTISRLSELISHNQSDYMLYMDRADMYRKINLNDDALADYNHVIALNAVNSNAYFLRGELFRDHFVDNAKAIADFSTSIALSGEKGSGHQYRMRGDMYLHRLNDATTALNDYNSAVEVDPNTEWSYSCRAQALEDLGRYDEALADWNRAIEINSRKPVVSFWLYQRRGNLYQTQYGDYRNALRDYNRAIVLDGCTIGVQYQRMSLLSHLGRVDEAQVAIRDLIESQPDGYYRHYQTALVEAAIKEVAAYINSCHQILNRFADSENHLEQHFAAWTCALAPDAVDDYEPAIRLGRFAVESDPENQQYLDGLGAILMRAGHYEEAHETLTQALDVPGSEQTSTSYIQYFLAMTQHHLGNVDDARQQLQRANESADEELAQSPPWNRRLTLELLRKEAEQLFGQTDDTPDNVEIPDLPPAPPLPVRAGRES